MTQRKNPAPVAAGNGASDSFATNEYPKHSTALPFPQYPAAPQDLPSGLNPHGIIARHFYGACATEHMRRRAV